MKKDIVIGLIIFFIMSLFGCGENRESGNIQWGTERNDYGLFTAVDKEGNVYITGGTFGNLDGNSNAGEIDIFLTKLKNNGSKEWTIQWGTSDFDMGNSISFDSEGNIYVAGAISGSSYTSSSYQTYYIYDVFLTKINSDGKQVWTEQWGTENIDYGASVTVDSNDNIYVAGYTNGDLDGNKNNDDKNDGYDSNDIFLTKFNSKGKKLWTRQWGTQEDESVNSILTDHDGNIYITGYTNDSDIFLAKLSDDGSNIWNLQWGTEYGDSGHSLALDADGSIFVVGATRGDLDGNINSNSEGHSPLNDVFLTKITNEGSKVWTKQWGTESDEVGSFVAVSKDSNILVTGSAGGDVFLTKLSSDGSTDTKYFGTEDQENVCSGAVDENGNVFIAGYTYGEFDENENAGGGDIFLLIINP